MNNREPICLFTTENFKIWYNERVERQNITLAIFDVRPVDPKTRRVDFDFIQNLKPEINLRKTFSKEIEIRPEIVSTFNPKQEISEELEATLSESFDFGKELESFGGQLIDFRIKDLQAANGNEDANLEKFRSEFSKVFSGYLAPPSHLPWYEPRKAYAGAVYQEKFKPAIYFSLGLALIFFLAFLITNSLSLKKNILERSNQAYINLSSAEKANETNFSEAINSFVLAAENFKLLEQDLKKAGSIFSVLDKVGFSGTANFSNLIKAGELISGAGVDLYRAFEKLSGANFVSLIQSKGENNILEQLNAFRLDLIQASRNLNQASGFISNLDFTSIPDSEKEKLEILKLKLPEFNGFIEKGANYAEGLMSMLGQGGPQRYIVLFQNTSELRPTGGFPGSYALVEFKKGMMEKFAVDDIYNPDGQMKEKIIPPGPLQRVTPNWGMRDANWFIDFRSSAKKIAEFYYKDTGVLVDGVLAVNVDLIPEILKITGPIEMPEFGITLGPENFIARVQEEIEYQRTKGENQPKQVLVEFAPRLLERLSSLSREDWLKVFTLLVKSVETKDILAYFVDSRLQGFALENGFAGEIKEVDSNYLIVTHSNIMGSKTDAVIENSLSLNIESDLSGGPIHTLKITRNHKGGDLGFYNRKNNDYIRLLVPQDAELIDISGNDSFEIKPLLDYGKNDFITDPDLEKYESDDLSEGGKKAIAFWMVVEPKGTKTVTVKYKTARYSSIYLQKQPGVKSGLKVIFNGKTLFDEKFSSDKNIVLE